MTETTAEQPTADAEHEYISDARCYPPRPDALRLVRVISGCHHIQTEEAKARCALPRSPAPRSGALAAGQPR
jgi:hypothetical protein